MRKLNKQLEEFLRHYKAYDAFIKNMQNPKCNGRLTLCSPTDEEYKTIRISNAFAWEQTPEGGEHWDVLDDLWFDMTGEKW